MMSSTLTDPITSMFGFQVSLVGSSTGGIYLTENAIKVNNVSKYISSDVLLQLVDLLNMPRKYMKRVSNRKNSTFRALVREELHYSMKTEFSFILSGINVIGVFSGEAGKLHAGLLRLNDALSLVGDVIFRNHNDGLEFVSVTSSEDTISPAILALVTRRQGIRLWSGAYFADGGGFVSKSKKHSSILREIPEATELNELVEFLSCGGEELADEFSSLQDVRLDDPPAYLATLGIRPSLVSDIFVALRGRPFDILGTLVTCAAKLVRPSRMYDVPYLILTGQELE